MKDAVKLDETDEAILELLLEDGRMPMREVARRIGVAEGTIRQRLRKLQDRGALRFSLVVDPQKIGFEAAAYLRIRCDLSEAPGLADRLSKLDEIVFSALAVGPWNVVVFAVTETRVRIDQLVETHIRSAPGVHHIDICEPMDIMSHRFDIARFI